RKLGIEVGESLNTPAQSSNPEITATFPGIELTGRTNGVGTLIYFDGRNQSVARNNWRGANTSHYSNPQYDALLDRVNSTLNDQEQAQAMKAMGEILATDLPILPMYYRIAYAAVARDVQALRGEQSGSNTPSLMSRNAYLWDRT